MCCGIAGGMNVPRATVEKMLNHQNSRGPDYTGIQEIGKVIFGHNRLSIVDKSENGNQPMQTDGSFLPHYITYNGEIYNYNDFKLGVSTDTKAILIELSSWGIDSLNDFNGMFAFAWYDQWAGNIYLVRDRFGIKPLYYTHQKDYFAFASTPAALTYTKPDWQISQKGAQEYLSLGATMLHSMFEGIEAVPPGYYLTFNINTNSVKLTRWYYPKYIENAKEIIKEKVLQAIDRVKLTCDWPQIILLSGGIDSTLVASRYQGQNAIHLRSPEEDYAQHVADKFKIKLNLTDPALESAEEGLKDFIKKSGEPTMAGLIPWITCKEIAKAGYRVAITANGADELFFGYDRMKGSCIEQLTHIQRLFSWRFQKVEAYSQNFGDTRQWTEICTYLMFDLNKTLDFASMCHSVEVRVPYLDHELVECALSISQDQHVGRYGNKTILKEMLLELGFDYDFIHRPKVGFSLHNLPADWHSLQDRAKIWYENSGYEQLPVNSTGRQQVYHQSTITGLYLWHKIWR
jgi:asparagine synthase (glutamine-hydrolysing)